MSRTAASLSPDPPPALEIDRLRITYRSATGPNVVAVEEMSLTVARGEFVCLLGPSGCGKSTTLLAVDGLLEPTAGEVRVAGRRVTAPGPDRAMVFQEFALMPWLTVLDNVAFGMRLQGVPGPERRQRALHHVHMMGLRGFEAAYPHQLSGGMRQRVGIARALAVDPQILLMDEPFGALDAHTRELMGIELLKIWDRERKTVVFVTHSLDEAIYLGDRVVVMTGRPGKVRRDMRIDLPRPRDHRVRNTPAFTAYRQAAWELLAAGDPAGLDVSGSETPAHGPLPAL